jgi:hypothetical protein
MGDTVAGTGGRIFGGYIGHELWALLYSISGILLIPLLVLHSVCMVVCVQYKLVHYIFVRYLFRMVTWS